MDALTRKAFDALIATKSGEFFDMVNCVKDPTDDRPAFPYEPRTVRDLLQKAFGLGIEVGEARGRVFAPKETE